MQVLALPAPLPTSMQLMSVTPSANLVQLAVQCALQLVLLVQHVLLGTV